MQALLEGQKCLVFFRFKALRGRAPKALFLYPEEA